MKEMLDFNQALDEVLSHINPLEAETANVSACLGQVMAEDVCASVDVPPQDIATMDGYAVRSADIRGASTDSSHRLRVIDTAFAGSPAKQEVSINTAIRIMTGAPLPEGADSVVSFEDTREVEEGNTSFIEVLNDVNIGSNILKAGGYVARGSLVVSKGTIIRPLTISLLASLGETSIPVIRRPLVAVIATGNELVEPGETLSEGQVYNSNLYGLAACIWRCGGIPRIAGIAGDSEADTIDCIRQALDADLIITSGGSSRGDHDLIRPILARLGEVIFSRIRVTPGKPLTFGIVEDNRGSIARKVPLLALPGSPSGCFVSFEMFARPAILKLAGKSRLAPPIIRAKMSGNITVKKDSLYFRWVRVERDKDEYAARPSHQPDGGILTSMAGANGLAIIPGDGRKIQRGDKIDVIVLDWQEENLI